MCCRSWFVVRCALLVGRCMLSATVMVCCVLLIAACCSLLVLRCCCSLLVVCCCCSVLRCWGGVSVLLAVVVFCYMSCGIGVVVGLMSLLLLFVGQRLLL